MEASQRTSDEKICFRVIFDTYRDGEETIIRKAWFGSRRCTKCQFIVEKTLEDEGNIKEM